MPKISLSKINPESTPLCTDKDQGLKQLQKYQKRIYELLYLMFAEDRRSLLIILQGIDTSGKDGVVKFIFDSANPQGIQVHSFKKPSDEELKHDFLWRCHKVTPASGGTSIFNRSYYEEVTVARVHPEILKSQHLPSEAITDNALFKKRYQQINDFERMLTNNGTTVLKFLLHITKAEQKQRLKKRLDDKTKNWKFSTGDIKERKYWNQYMKAFEQMMAATNTIEAPWNVVPANKKWYRDLVIAKIIVEHLESLKMKFPEVQKKPPID